MVEMYADITKQEHLVDDIFSMILRCPAISEVAHSGQFVSVYSKDSARLLPRPISNTFFIIEISSCYLFI